MNTELSPYQLWQLEKYGNIIQDVVPVEELIESGVEEMNRLAEWMELHSEQQQLQQQYEFEYKQ